MASRAQDDWEFGFEALGDPHHDISRTCSERGWLELIVNEKLEFLDQSARKAGSSLAGWVPTHPKGYFQPGVLALDATGRVLYRWRGIPHRGNMGGATERPTAEHVWSNVSRAREAADATADAALDEDPPLDQRGIPWPIFALLLLANGWFVRPQGFPHVQNGRPPQKQFLFVALRILGFVGGWALAFAWLPNLLVAAAFAGWVAWIVPQVRFINDEFQNMPA